MKELNLIPYSIKEKRIKRTKIKKYIAYGIIALSIMFLGVYIPKVFLSVLKGKEEVLKAEANKSKIVIEESNKIKSEIENLNKRKVLIDSITKQRILVSSRLTDIEKQAPTDVIITDLNYNNSTVILNGNAKNYNSVSEFTANLQNSKKYKSAKIVNISAQQGNGPYGFTINVIY